MQKLLLLNDLDTYANKEFNRAMRIGVWRQIFSWFTKRCNELQRFDRDRLTQIMRGQRYLGLKTVPLDQIVGSEGRFRDFDRAFFPRKKHTIERWLSLAKARYQSVALPPVDLVKVGDSYFVMDGNHRISVARAWGQQFIEAEVVEVLTAVPVPSPC